jgi:hypothetical protein
VTQTSVFRKLLPFACVTLVIGACASGPQVTNTLELSESADVPYENVLVITLFSSFDSRRYLETEVVKKLSALGIRATASTSLMDSRTPATRETFLEMVADIDADAVLVTRLVDLNTRTKMVDMSPEVTYNIRPTYYYNVFSVDVEEYVAPQMTDVNHSLILGTELYSASNRDVVWAIESKSKVNPNYGESASYSVFVDEAEAIVARMSRDGLVKN